VIGAKQRCHGLILLYVSLKHGRSQKKPGMHLDQPHKGMKAAKNVASLSPRWRGIKEVELSAEEIWEVYNMNSHKFFFSFLRSQTGSSGQFYPISRYEFPTLIEKQ